jgi:hypothetical protein
VLLLAALWGKWFFFFQVMVAALPPFTAVLVRVGLAALVLNLWLAVRRTSAIRAIALSMSVTIWWC